jgi:uncharacterized membrane protein YbaN (DUF454 family)
MRRLSLRKAVLVSAGMISLALGAIGIFVPLMPTTVFLLIAAACFVRSSEGLYRWLMTHRLFGSYIRNYREHRAMPARTKAFVLLLLWATIGYSAVYAVDSLPVRLLLAAVAIGVTIHLLSLKAPPGLDAAPSGAGLSAGRNLTGPNRLP